VKLEAQLQSVTEEFKRQVPSEVFDTMVAAIDALAGSGAFEDALKPGDRMPGFELPDSIGHPVRSQDLLARGPLLLTFYRGDWCPYCNLALRALHDELPAIAASGTTLVAVSPQTPDFSLTTRQKLMLDFPVLSDARNLLARQFGIVFTLAEQLRPLYAGFGIDITRYNGDGSFELPVPATYLVGTNGIISQRYLDIDFRRRVEPEIVLGWLDNHAKTKAAAV
jgi:peroxiredoxin